MLVLVRGDPAFTKTEVIGLDILAPRHPKLYSLIVGRLGYDINANTNIVSNRQGNVDESCQPDATGRQICLKVISTLILHHECYCISHPCLLYFIDFLLIYF